MTKTITQRTSRKNESGCFVSCCVGIATAVALLFLIGLLILLVLFTMPQKKCAICRTGDNRSSLSAVSSSNLSPKMSEDEIWQQCGPLAKKRNLCVTDCSTRPSTGLGNRDKLEVPEPLRLTDLRLNKTLLPTKYNIELQPWIYNITNARLDGMEEIFMRCMQSTNVIVLHAANITVDQSSIELRENDANGRKKNVMNFEVDAPRQFIKIYPQSPLIGGRNYYVKMKFNGTLLHRMTGFYRATYTYLGEPRYIAVTQFEEAEARKAFPCFDEPSFKARFVITLIRKPDYVALSNMEIDRTEIRDSGRWVADRFRETPVMSTYTIAMFVGQYVKKERTTPRGTLVRIWTQPNYIQYADFALSISGEIIEAFEDWTGIKYPLEKTDQIAVKEFAAGAMENWGLVVYAEHALLYNPAYSGMEAKRRVADVIAHELAHQWFGNLVTMDWWDDTFLNEGFATYMGFHVGVDSVRKNWDMDTFFMRQTQNIMAFDTTVMTQPVILEGLDQYWELHKAFSGITYNKGAALIRMIKYFLGESTFQKAIQNYLKKYSYSTAVVEDLIDAFNQQAIADGRVTWDTSKANLSMILDSWLRQMNYPLVEVTDLRNGKLKVQQSRFVHNASAPVKYPPPTGEFLWYIPFTYADNATLKRGGYNMEWIYDFSDTLDTKTDRWKLANVYSQGFYRVKYDPYTWAAIVDQLKTDHKLIPVESRAEIIDDAFMLANEGKMSEADALSATEYLVNETEYLPWYPALNGRIVDYEKLLGRTPTYTHLNNYILSLVIPNYQKLGWDNSNPSEHMEKYLRVLMIKEACKRKYQPCVLEALKQFQQYVDNMRRGITNDKLEIVNPIDPDFRNIVYCTAMAHGGPDVWENMMSIFLEVFSNEDYTGGEINSVLLGMVCVDDPVNIDTMLEWALQFNLTGILQLVATRPNTISTLWDYLDRRWDSIPRGIQKVSLLWSMTDYFATENDLRKLRTFIENHPDISSKESKQLIDKVKANKVWLDKNQSQLRDWLKFKLPGHLNRRKRRSLLDTLKGKELWQTGQGAKSGNDQYKEKIGLDARTNRFQFQVKNGAVTLEVDTSFNSAPIF